MLSLKDRRRSAVRITAEIEEVGRVSLLVLRLYAAFYMKLVCMAVTPGGSLFWRRYTKKPANSLLKTCQQSTWITGTMSYGLMRWRLICLVLLASSMCGGDQVRSTKISVSCLQSSMLVGMSWSVAAWVLQVLHFIEGNMNYNMYCEILQQRMTPSLQKLGRRAVFEHDKGKGDGLTKHISRLEPNRTSLGDPQAEGGGAQSLKNPPAPRRRYGGVEERSSGYPWSSGKLHAQESKGSSG